MNNKETVYVYAVNHHGVFQLEKKEGARTK